jgi:hypothetical protein
MSKFSNIVCAISFTTFIFATGCATAPANQSDEYKNAVEAHSAGDLQYEGAYNNFGYRATIMNESMQRLYINKKAELYLWSDEKKIREISALQSTNGESTKIFLSFFTPNRWDDNLSTSKSIWSVYLHSGGNRYEGKVTKIRDSRTELNALFPYHGRFASAYNVEFMLPVSQLNLNELKITITGPLGVKTVEFPNDKATSI